MLWLCECVCIIQSFWMMWWLMHATGSVVSPTLWPRLCSWSSMALSKASRNKSTQLVSECTKMYSLHVLTFLCSMEGSSSVTQIKTGDQSHLSYFTSVQRSSKTNHTLTSSQSMQRFNNCALKVLPYPSLMSATKRSKIPLSYRAFDLWKRK